MMKKLSALFLGAALLPAAHAAWQPGLWQAKFSTFTTFAATCSGDVMDHPTLERVPGTVMADVWVPSGANVDLPQYTYTNPFPGGSPWNWNTQNTGWGYVGQMRVVKGATYTFGKLLDDAARVIIDGKEVINHSTWDVFAWGSYTAQETGWVSFDARVWDGSGGKGACSTWQGIFGIAFNTIGVTTAAPTTNWIKRLDPGDGSLFRCDDGLGSRTK